MESRWAWRQMHAARTCICVAMRQTPNRDPFKDVPVVKEKTGSVVLVSFQEAETGMGERARQGQS